MAKSWNELGLFAFSPRRARHASLRQGVAGCRIQANVRRTKGGRNGESVDSRERDRGTLLTNLSGEALGKIDELVLDKAERGVGYAVLALAGALGMVEKPLANTWSALRCSVQRGARLLDPDAPKLAPGFREAEWPNLPHPNWDTQVLSYDGPPVA